MLNLSSMMVGTKQFKVMAKFYEELFQKPADMVDGESYIGWNAGSIFFSIGEHSEMGGMAKDPGRIMFNFDSKDVKGDFDRISQIEGVKVVKAPYSMGEGDQVAWIATLADPDGNYFQLMTPWAD